MENARTLRFDLGKVTREDVITFLREKGDKMVKVILYEEIAEVTKKLHLQGWCQFGSDAEATNFQKNRLKKWKLESGLETHEASCATVKKDSYFAYTAKDKKCVYVVGVSDEERIANEEKSYKKKGEVWRQVYETLKDTEWTKKTIAKEVLKIYLEQERPMYTPTIRAIVNLVYLKLGGEAALDILADQVL